MARSAEDARASVKRENLRPAPPAPVPAQEAPLPTLPPCPVGCARAGAPREGGRPRFLPGQAPVGRKGERPATRSPRAGSNRQTPDMGPPSPVMRVFRGAGHMCFRRERQRRRKYIRPVPRNASLLTFSARRKYLPAGEIFLNPPTTQFWDRGSAPMTPWGRSPHTPGQPN